MPENRQFTQRLGAWHTELQRHVLEPLTPVAFSGAFTFNALSPQEASGLSGSPMPAGTAWGRYREYGWFSAEVTLPEGCAGRRIVLCSGIGGEQLVYLDGQAMGSVDRQHAYVTLFRQAPAEGCFRLLIESYAGNGPRLENLGPLPPERQALPPVPEYQQRVGESCLACVNEDAYQLYMDADTLIRLWKRLPDGSLRRQRVEAALRDYIHTADFECSREERNASFRKAREALAPVLACRNGDSAPELEIIGQSHIDLAWLWPMEESRHKVARTFANQLALMDEYPEYRFLACEPALLEMLKERSPELYARMLEKIQSGQILPEGAFYAECDTNIPSGESLIRQLVRGKRWFREELGTEIRVAWQPDTFGFAPCLPQILKALDIPYFATQKLLRADPECERFPWQDFTWEGADGSRVQALSFFKNNARTDPDNLLDRWEKHRTQTEGIETLLYPFGYGDGGGGADRDMLEYLRREKNLEGLPRTVWRSLPQHFERAAEGAAGRVWHGELYLSWHRGTYTVQRKTKLAIQRLEQALHDAEFLLALSRPRVRVEARAEMDAAWKTLMIHQFHDIAAGVGIQDVHREAEERLADAEAGIRKRIRGLAEDICRMPAEDASGAVTVLNTLPFERKEYLELPDGSAGYVRLPASGAAVIAGAGDTEPLCGSVRVCESDEGWRIENGVLAFTLTRDGAVTGLTDLRTGLPLQEPGMRMNDLRLYRDVEPVYDAWELSRDYVLDRTDEVRTVSVTLSGAETPELTAVIGRQIGGSGSRQEITVRAGEPRILFETEIDWQERHKLLKAHFETNLRTDEAVCGMQFCHVRRPAHRSTAFARDRYEVCHQHYSALFEADHGVVLMNRGIRGISCEEGDLALTLLRAPCVPDDTCDRGTQRFSWVLQLWDRPFCAGTATRDAYAYQTPPLMLPGAGHAFESFRAENALIETIKPADQGEGTILRLWEPRGARSRVTVRLPEPMRIFTCSPDEANPVPLAAGREASFELHAFGIQTLLLMPEAEQKE